MSATNPNNSHTVTTHTAPVIPQVVIAMNLFRVRTKLNMEQEGGGNVSICSFFFFFLEETRGGGRVS